MSAPKYLQLNAGGTRARMSCLRMAAIENNRNRPDSMHIDWRAARHYGFGNWRAAYCEMGQGLNDGAPIWYTHTGEKFRNEEYCDLMDGVRIDHTGWYCDPDQQSTARGIVGALTHGRFIAGYELSDNGERVYFGEVFDNHKDAAQMADEHARIAADHEMDYQTRASEANGIQYEIECAVQRLKECLVLRNTKCMDYVRVEISMLVTSIRADRDRLSADYANYI